MKPEEVLQSVGDKISDVGGKLTTHVTAPLAAAGTAAVKTASDFDSAMSKLPLYPVQPVMTWISFVTSS